MKHWGCTHDNTPPLPSGSSMGGGANGEVTVTMQGGERQNRRVDKGDSEQRGGLRGAFGGDFWGGRPGHFLKSGLREIRNSWQEGRDGGKPTTQHVLASADGTRDSIAPAPGTP